MKLLKNKFHIFHSRKYLLFLLPVLLAGSLAVGMALWFTTQKVQALPEYSTRTGESCAACHVSAGGGGPRTLRGLLWSAKGKPDKVPVLPGMNLAPHVSDGGELYQIACAGCHGIKGEGLSARGLTNTHISEESIRSFTVKGILPLSMPAFKGQFTDAQMENLIQYVAGLANGKIEPPADTYQLPPSHYRCTLGSNIPTCSNANPESGGN